MTQNSTAAQAASESAQTFEETLLAQKLAISGVSVDEEAINMLAYQRAYQAVARYLTTINELFETLLDI